MTTPRVSATMLSARRHVEGRRGMPGMIPRGARGPGARREGGLIGPLRAQVPDGPGRAGGGPGACPRCGGTRLACEGRDGDGSQGRSRRSCGRAPSRRAMGLLGCPEPEEDVWAGRAPAPSGRGQPSPARSTARAPASHRPAGGPGRRRCCPGSRGARRRRAPRWKTNRV